MLEHKNFAGKIHKLTRMLTALSEYRWASDGYVDIKIAHLQALTKLIDGNYNNNQLAEDAGITKQSMNRLTNELLHSGYVEIAEKQSTDGRMKILALSKKGKLFINYLNTTRNDLENKLANVMGVSRFEQLNNILDNLLAFVESRHKSI